MRLGIQPGFGFGNGLKARNDAIFVVIKPNAEVNFVASGIVFETLHQRQDRIARIGVNFLKHEGILQVYSGKKNTINRKRRKIERDVCPSSSGALTRLSPAGLRNPHKNMRAQSVPSPLRERVRVRGKMQL
jgi:hypothetical protein